MDVITTVTQKGQITLPKNMREKLGIKKYGKVHLRVAGNYLAVRPVKDILDLAGSFRPVRGKSLLKAREKMEKNYRRF
ncbi:MAG: AbrB/MazE/SpoVT family DNA-binding domain-containing protein [bacterium]|nr:AbrB/MazE/SpoVT family DNA-binding domain-containing protein [bacterium]